MYRISELARSAGLSRATLLYYEKLGLLAGRRSANGYRVYSDADRQRLALLRRLQAGGLSLEECRACLDGRIDRERLAARLLRLEAQIAAKQRSRDLLAALLGRSSLRAWHEEIERVAPDLHRAWLERQGFSSEEAARVAWLSKDMNAHQDYMADFMAVFSGLERWGPGTTDATLRALSLVPFVPETILEIGCGNGPATLPLAQRTAARIVASDTDDAALERLRATAAARGLADRIAVRHLDMARLPVPDRPFDVIWAEGSAYVIGVERALEDWRPQLRPGGALAFSDMVWRTAAPSEAQRTFWASEYPTMTTVAARLEQATHAGYRILGHFDMGREAMDAYYGPLEARVEALAERLAGRPALADLRAELGAWRAGDGSVGYEMFVLQRP